MEAKKEREEMKWVKKKRGDQKRKRTNGQIAERHELNDAQRPQQATLGQRPDRRHVFFNGGNNRIPVVLPTLRGGAQGWRAQSGRSSLVFALSQMLFLSLQPFV